jgi:hypothetical protein
MAKELSDTWKKILFHQRFPLIGSTVIGEGNGFHDRLSFDIPYIQRQVQASRYDHWLYVVYFRDLLNSCDPKLKERLENEVKFEILNCSEGFRSTLIKYISGGQSHYRGEIVEFVSEALKYLLHDGRVIFEFVSWFANDDKQFYAFELKRLPIKNLVEKRTYYSYQGTDPSGSITKVKIPKQKCITIDWPNELGGLKQYNKTVSSVLGLGPKIPSTEDTVNLDPGVILARRKNWDKKFSQFLAPWGLMNPDGGLTEFYKEYNSLKVRRTGIFCLGSVIQGLRQLVRVLNEKLDEKASLSLTSAFYDITRYEVVNAKWLKGEIGFKEANAYIRE